MRQFETERGEGRLHLLFNLLAQSRLIGRHIEKRHLAGGEDVGHASDDRVAQLAFEIADVDSVGRVPLTWVKKVRGSAMRKE